MRFIQITSENNNVVKDYPVGIDYMSIAYDQNIKLKGGILGVYATNKIQELNFTPIRPATVRFFGLDSADGQSVYARTLFFVLYAAIHDLFRDYNVTLEFPVSSGYFCTAKKGKKQLNPDEIQQVKDRMIEIIKADIPITRIDMLTEEAIKLFEDHGLSAKTKLLRTRGSMYTSVYSLGSAVDYFYGYLAPSTGCLSVFDLFPYKYGMVLSVPDEDNDFKTPKVFVEEEMIFNNYAEFNRWQEAFQLDTVGELNEAILDGRVSDIIKVVETSQEVRIHQAAHQIAQMKKKVKIILLAGPSSSGKTTSAQRLAIHLEVLGIKCYKLSLDDYFVDREHTPRDKDGNYDFETIDAIDIKFFNEQLNDLLGGKEIELPRFDFHTGKRVFRGEKLKLNENDMVVIEGLHGLNPNLVPNVDPKCVYKIFVSTLTTISIDGHNIIPPTDNRLIRRIVRDQRFRGYSAEETINRWPSIREGEKKYIEPYQSNADFTFNSAMLYELSVLKTYVRPLLEQVPQTSRAYSEAHRLSKFMSYFEPVSVDEIPPTSLMREFLGGSSFKD